MNKASIYHQKDQLYTRTHSHPRTPPPTKIFILAQSKKIRNRIRKMGPYIKVYFCFANFFCKRLASKYFGLCGQYALSQLASSAL